MAHAKRSQRMRGFTKFLPVESVAEIEFRKLQRPHFTLALPYSKIHGGGSVSKLPFTLTFRSLAQR